MIAILIEFDGITFHPDDNLNTEKLLEWTNPFGVIGTDVRRNDIYKTELALKNGFRLIRINEKTNVNKFLKQIEEIINEN